MIAIIGFALAGVTRQLHSFQVLIVSLSAPLVSALCAALIVIFSWGPNEAVWPICSLLTVYSVVAIPALVFAYAHIAKSSESPKQAWQFSLKSLLILTTVICVVLALGPIVLRSIWEILPSDEDVGFGGFSVVVFGIAFGFLTDYFIRYTGKQPPMRSLTDR